MSTTYVPHDFHSIGQPRGRGRLYRKLCHFSHPVPVQGASVSTVLVAARRGNGRVANEVCHRQIGASA